MKTTKAGQQVRPLKTFAPENECNSNAITVSGFEFPASHQFWGQALADYIIPKPKYFVGPTP